MKKLMLASAMIVLGLSVNAQAEAPAKYNMYCMACHGTGAAGAPKTGDKAAWEPRLAAGIDAMVASAKKGKNAMPPMGLCSDCSDAELKELIEFMSK
ncbi:c-type cytochrome [Ketobacter alkanivorans]|uniref:Cytochrome C n=1 Tax=Ketobacter alkanivorans TaxID=1917421 RepID=A0A2K9LKI1_9GAMM|nr:c-type cytochrome [Ketobacter alkanivorans]AUM12792.1 cytochrome C [Ketobacter alkanivorans]MCP5014582.1 cytochrome c5 family protein [Ketobacter sp.]